MSVKLVSWNVNGIRACLKKGFEDSEITEIVAIENVLFDEGDETVTLPDTFLGKPITHLAYQQDVIPAHEHFADWHHPSQGSEWRAKEYRLSGISISVPARVKKIIIPATIKYIYFHPFKFGGETEIEKL